MPDNKIGLEFFAKNEKLLSVVRQSEAAIKTYGDKTLSVMKRVNDSIVSSYNRLGALAPLGIGVGFGVLAKNVMDFDGALRSIRRSGGYSKEDMEGLRKQILDLSQDIPATNDQFAAMAKELNATGIPLSTIKRILPDVAKGAKAAGLDTSVYAATVGELMDKFKVAEKDLPVLQEQLHKAMKFEDVRKNPEEFLKALQSLSETMQLVKSEGMTNTTPLIALLAQLTKYKKGGAMEAAASIDAVYNGILRISKNKDVRATLEKEGVSFFNPDRSIKNVAQLLPVFKKLDDVIKKYGKSPEEVDAMLFGRPGATRSVMTIKQHYDEFTKSQEELKKSSSSAANDYADAQESMTNKLIRFQNQINKFNVEHMSGALSKLSGVLDFLNAHPLVTKGIMFGLLGAGGLVMINKVIEAVRGIGGLFGGKGPGGIAGGLGKTPQPVYVVNFPGQGYSMPYGGGWGGGLPGAPGGAGGAAGSIMGIIGKVAAVAGTATAAYEFGSWIESKFIKGGIGNWIYDATHKNENKINLTVNVEKNRITTDSDDMNTDIDVNRGYFGMD